jgi:predicted glycoside hydrolase/deacetylase ChbG (UPF0249 family)
VKKLIVTADDFGLTHSVNEGVWMAAREGIVTNINLIPTGDASTDAIAIVKYNKIPEIGVHLALTETRPVTNIRLIASLVDKGGAFPASRVKFLRKLFSGRIDIEQVKIELKSQMDKAAQSGARITNLSSHEHLHMIPELFKVLAGLAKEYGVRYLRVLKKEAIAPPISLSKVFRSALVGYFYPGMEKLLKRSGLNTADNFLGFLDSGAVREDVLLRMLGSVGEGVTELVTHPGFLEPEILERHRFHINCEEELYALTSPKAKKAISDNGIKLCRYGDLEMR